MKKIAILQSNYIPWKGYFDMLAYVDEFVIYDDMQYTKNDWRNRNKIKTPQGVQWLTIPTGQNIERKIRDVRIDSRWQVKHWKTLENNYRRAPCFNAIAEWLEPIYMQTSHEKLSAVNRILIEAINKYLGIKTKISNSWDYEIGEGKTERLINLCTQAEATEYVSGPSAKNYIEPSIFEASNIKLTWFDYTDYPEYPQLWGEFSHAVSILDLLFNVGHNSPKFMHHVLKEKKGCQQ